MSPRDLDRALARTAGEGAPRVGDAVDGVHAARSTAIRVAAPVEVRARLGAGLDLPAADLPPALLSSLKHAASMPNPEFSARQRRRASTHGIPGSSAATPRRGRRRATSSSPCPGASPNAPSSW